MTNEIWDDSERDDHDELLILLEPWFAGESTLSGALEPLFDQLMECYVYLGNTRKREGLVTKLIERGDTVMRAVALQRRCMMLADRGDYVGAWEVFTVAQHMAPENLSLAPSPSRGNCRRVMMSRSASVRDDPRAALATVDPHRHPALVQLEAMLADAPQLGMHYSTQDLGRGEFVLEPDAVLRKLEKRWRVHFPEVKPGLTATQSGDDGMRDNPQGWLDILGRNPLCWQSFEVLNDVALAVDALQAIDTDKTLLARGVALLDANVATLLGSERRLSWMSVQNRPALRLLAHRTFRALEDPERGVASDDFIELAESDG